MGNSLGDVAHVERGEGRWLRDCVVELVLALLDDRLEVFEDVEVVFSRGQDGLVELLLLWGDGSPHWHLLAIFSPTSDLPFHSHSPVSIVLSTFLPVYSPFVCCTLADISG